MLPCKLNSAGNNAERMDDMKKQNFRRYLSLLLAALMLSALAGCAPKPMQDSVPPTPTPTEKEKIDADELFAHTDEARQGVRDYGYNQAALYGSPGVEFDPWVSSWDLTTDITKAGTFLTITVHREFDIPRAEALRQEYDCIRVEYEPPEKTSKKSTLNEADAQVCIYMDMEAIPPLSADLPSQGVWRASFTWDRELTTYVEDDWWMEAYNEDVGEWYKLRQIHGGRLDMAFYIHMEPGEYEWFVSTANYSYDFQPGRYRYIYTTSDKNDYSVPGAYFIGEFEITEENAA